MVDNKTGYLHLPLPHEDNLLEEDVARLRTAFSTLDTHAQVTATTLTTKADAETVHNALEPLRMELGKKADAETVNKALEPLRKEVAQKATSTDLEAHKQKPHPNLSHSVTSTSQTDAASSLAVKTAYDKGVAAQTKADTAQATAGTAQTTANAKMSTNFSNANAVLPAHLGGTGTTDNAARYTRWPCPANGDWRFESYTTGDAANFAQFNIWSPYSNAGLKAGYAFYSGGGNANCMFYPLYHGSLRVTLGNGDNIWGQIYSTSSTISTSDEREKQQIADIPDTVLDAWGDVKWMQFKMNDAVELKGDDTARLHTGLVVQQIVAVFARHGLDAFAYGLVGYDEWDAKDAVYRTEIDVDGEEQHILIAPAIVPGDRYNVRLEEAEAMEAAYQRREIAKLEARLAALEAKQ